MAQAKQLSATLGNRLREERKQRGLTLSEVSGATGISVSMLSKIENGHTTLNFNNVLKIAEGLNIPVASLLGPEEDAPAGRRAITRHGGGVVHDKPQLHYEVLCDDLAHKKNIYWRVTVKARSVNDYPKMSRHPGEEFLMVLKGAIELHTDLYKPVLLEVGDSICFDSAMGHAYVCVSDEPAELMMSNTIAFQPVSGFSDT